MKDICIVIPCYNEEKRLPVEAFENYLETHLISFCFVDDGSTDNTFLVLEKLRSKFSEKVIVIKNISNIGKAESVRKGINYALKFKDFEYVGYFDADLATPLSEINHLLQFLVASNNYAFALGSRILRLGVKIERYPSRHYVGRVFATFASIVLKLPVYDTQCGAKIFKSDLARNIFEKPFISKWLFDIELIARTKKKYPINVFIEIPLNEWVEIGDTKIKFLDVMKFPFDLIKIYSFYKNQHYENDKI
jgi:glycosyltransferase involved in cell wall biosynthesis